MGVTLGEAEKEENQPKGVSDQSSRPKKKIELRTGDSTGTVPAFCTLPPRRTAPRLAALDLRPAVLGVDILAQLSPLDALLAPAPLQVARPRHRGRRTAHQSRRTRSREQVTLNPRSFLPVQFGLGSRRQRRDLDALAFLPFFVNGRLEAEHEVRLLLDEELEDLLAPAMLAGLLLRATRSRGSRNGGGTSAGRESPVDKAGEAEQGVVAAASRRDEAGLEDDGEVRGRHEVLVGATSKDGQEVEKVQEEVSRGGREQRDQVAIGGDRRRDGLRFLCLRARNEVQLYGSREERRIGLTQDGGKVEV